MKKRILTIGTAAFFLLGVFSLTSCDSGFTGDDDVTAGSEADVAVTTDTTTATASCISDLPVEELSDSEKVGILYMREEEKLARDVYTYLYDKWNIRTFLNISKSEQAHMDAIKLLIDRYELTDPVGDHGYGVFTNPDLQALYDTLVGKGSVSEIEALKVGALIEEVDINDLQEELDSYVDNQDITKVYSNLRAGSETHLRAFVWNLKVRGVEYAPVLLSLEEYESIINKD